MSALNSKQWTAGHIGTASFKSHPVVVEPSYFVETRHGRIYVNDEPADTIGNHAIAVELILRNDYRPAETIPGSGVYRMTLPQLLEIVRWGLGMR